MTFSAWYKFVISAALLGAVGCGGGGSSGIAGGGAGGEGGDDGAAAFSISDVELKEGNVGSAEMEFTVTLSRALDEVAKVAYETQDDTASSEGVLATGGLDYESSSATLRFDPGETEQTFRVTVNADRLFEDDETFRVKLSNPIGAVLPHVYGVGTILN